MTIRIADQMLHFAVHVIQMDVMALPADDSGCPCLLLLRLSFWPKHYILNKLNTNNNKNGEGSNILNSRYWFKSHWITQKNNFKMKTQISTGNFNITIYLFRWNKTFAMQLKQSEIWKKVRFLITKNFQVINLSTPKDWSDPNRRYK